MNAPEALELLQRRQLRFRTYTLTNDGMIVQERHLLKHASVTIPYHEFTGEHFSTTVYSKIWMGLTILSTILMAVVVISDWARVETDPGATWFYAGAAALFGALALQSWHRVIGLVCRRGVIYLWASSPSTEVVARFVARLGTERDTYLQRMVASANEDTTSVATELARLQALREQGVLSREEFDVLKQRVINPGDSVE